MANDKQQRLIEWQRKLSPYNYVKPTAAQYKTAPSIVLPGSPDHPENAPEDSITISFFISGTSWLADDTIIRNATDTQWTEKPPQSKKAKHGPIFVMTTSKVLAIMPTTENYYYAAYELTKHNIHTATFKPGKPDDKGKRTIFCCVTFIPTT